MRFGLWSLPLIRNKKTVDPRDKHSPEVFQLETAMGAAIECFPDARAVDVPRSRFAPVKTTADLLTLRSDAYDIRHDGTVALAPELGAVPPRVELDHHYKLVDGLEAAIAGGVPSLKGCQTLWVKGEVRFHAGVIVQGDVTIENPTHEPLPVPAGIHYNTHPIL